MQESIKDILIRRDGMTEDEAINLIEEAKEALQEYLENFDIDGAENICQEFFGLEPDYMFQLID